MPFRKQITKKSPYLFTLNKDCTQKYSISEQYMHACQDSNLGPTD